MVNPSIIILPYIDTGSTSTQKSTARNNTDSSSSSAPASGASFSEQFEAAKRATAAVAIDALVLASGKGAVDPNEVQNYFNAHNINIQVPFAGTSSSSDASATSETPSSVETVSSETAETSGSTVSGTPASESAQSEVNVDLNCSETLNSYFKEAAELYNVDIKLLKAVAKVESNFDSSVTSETGAMGIMQLMPDTVEELGIKWPYDARENILGGARLLSQYLAKYNGDKELALAAYNAGPGSVSANNNQVPSSARAYVDTVLAYYNL